MSIVGPFKIDVAAELSGLEIGMVDYLCRQGIVTPSESSHRVRGKARLYSFGDVLMLRSLSHLLSKGVSVSRLKDALKVIRKRYPDAINGVSTQRFLVTNGTNIFLRSEDNVFEEINKSGQFVFSFIVDLHAVKNDVSNRISLMDFKKIKKNREPSKRTISKRASEKRKALKNERA